MHYSIAPSLTWFVTHVTKHSAKDGHCQGVFPLIFRLNLCRNLSLGKSFVHTLALAEMSEAVSADERTVLSKWPKFVQIVVVPLVALKDSGSF